VTTAIILAGGMGTRLRSVVPDLPKPMAPINGRPFLEYQMDYWINQGVKNFIISVGYMKEVIMDHFGSSYKTTPLSYSIELEPLGTGGGLLLAAQGLSEPFLVLNGDTFFEVELKILMKFHLNRSSEWTFSLFRANEIGRYMGIKTTPDGEITSFQSGVEDVNRLANGGVYLLNQTVIEKLKGFYGHKLSLEEDILIELVNQGSKLYGMEFDKKFIDIGLPDDYFRASQILQG
jgi:D-glycero-alpha-D-manno-heptose 1-phosphate guanylyltransferase